MLNVEIVRSSSNFTMFLRSPLNHPPLFESGSHSVNQAGLGLTVQPYSFQLPCSVFLVCEAALELFERFALTRSPRAVGGALPCPLSPDSPAVDPLVVGWKPKAQEL